MLTEMARIDIEHLTARGVTMTPERVVRLNDLSLRCARGADAARFVAAPRVAWAGDTPVYEPSIAAEVWIQEYATAWWRGASLNIAVAWACANCAEPDFFADKTVERHVRALVQRWRRGLGCTRAQLDIALDYALNGAEREDADGDSAEQRHYDGCPYTDLINDAVAAQLGSADELARRPRRIIEDIVRRWLRNEVAKAGGKPDSIDARDGSRAYMAYSAYVDELEKEAAGG